MLDATQALTVFAEIADGDELARRLKVIADDLDGNRFFRPRELPDTHFMRFVIVTDRFGELPDLLAWETNHDGRAVDYLNAVADAAPAIDDVFVCCAGYPGTARRAEWLAWMTERSRRSAAFYTGYRGVPRAEIANDVAVHDAIREVIDVDPNAFHLLAPCDVQRRICDEVRTKHPELDTSAQDDEDLRWLIGKILAGLALLVVLPLLVVLAVPFYLALRTRERADNAAIAARRSETLPRPVHVKTELSVVEDRVTQNQLTHVVDIKPGWFRLATVTLVLTVIDIAARVYSVNGDLGGIVSIHFARWVIVPDRRPVQRKRHRLVFFSNYDGSWEAYLGEFIDRAAYGLTAIWSNTEGFPATNNLLGDGARDEEGFKQWTRDRQIPTQVWWSGVPDATVQNVRDDVWIRRRLDRGLSEDDAQRWLRKL